MSILVPLGLVLSSVGFTPALAQLAPFPVYGAQPTGFGAVELGLLGALLLSLVYCGDPPIKSCYTLRSFTGRFLGSTASYANSTDTTKLIKIKCIIRAWERLPPCPISCGDPPTISGLALLDFTSGTFEGNTRYYICTNRNFAFSKDSPASSSCPTVTCQSNGQWTSLTATCVATVPGQVTNPTGSFSGTSGNIFSPDYPNNYPDTAALYRYSIVTPGKSITFTFNFFTDVTLLSSLRFYCGLDKTAPTVSFNDTILKRVPPQVTCPTGCANIELYVPGPPTGIGFNITWQANL